ncbi:hypothetical protein E2C01_099347 [Portunus trituberculatus]|uniref:Uncharacterized protein n=1 Tax=Portunus trituberculatus TaxID=210409 RepID=A0A5B7K9D9_PORTR|nr:hypothetical protein [Portunus trituberculatus]
MAVAVVVVAVAVVAGCSKVVVMVVVVVVVVERHSAEPDGPLMGGWGRVAEPPLVCVCVSAFLHKLPGLITAPPPPHTLRSRTSTHTQ